MCKKIGDGAFSYLSLAKVQIPNKSITGVFFGAVPSLKSNLEEDLVLGNLETMCLSDS